MQLRFLAPGLFGLVITAGAWVAARELPYQALSAGLGPAFFPHLLIGLLAVLSISMSLYGLLTKSSAPPSTPQLLAKIWRPILLFVLLAVFGLNLERIPAQLSVFTFLTLAMVLLGEQWHLSLLYAGIASLLLYLLFGAVFGLPLYSL